MANGYTIHIGTVGGGLSSTPDRGETWNRIRDSLPSECNVRALAAYPNDPHRILAGSDVGLFRSEDNGLTYQELDTPIGDLQIWSVTVDAQEPDNIFVGTRPDAFRSKDGGKNWEKLNIPVNIPCPVGIPRTTNMIVDPRDHRTIWAGIEVDGVYKSLDGGGSWVHLPDLGDDPFHGDIHGMALKTGPNAAVYCTTPFGISTSTDEGESWGLHEFPKFNDNDRRSYCRGMTIMPNNPDVMFVGNGDAIPGITGAIRRTKDAGKTWDAVSLPVAPNSVVYWFGTHAEVPDVIAAGSLYGYVYLSEDGGENWQKLDKEFGEIRSVMLTPN
ncbi:MAG: WD40/YVTN/BNR-like repeat-containing protein [Dehalococcoidia bacterium]